MPTNSKVSLRTSTSNFRLESRDQFGATRAEEYQSQNTVDFNYPIRPTHQSIPLDGKAKVGFKS